jgi:hypothetical protein
MKLQRYVYCVKPGSGGCVNDPDVISADAGWMHWCPGCKNTHAIAVEKPFENGARWTFDGNMEAPTFAPSVKVNWPEPGRVCHYFIKAGNIEFCSDSTHALAGKTVPLPEWPEGEP